MSEQNTIPTPETKNSTGAYSHEAPAWLFGEDGAQEGNYQVTLDQFHGPMELLLYLIRKDELDLYDIPIARITKQYLEYVELIHELNLEAAGDFVLMAATLIRIKAKLLLPREEVEGEELDPREELVMALLEYKRFKEAGDALRQMREDEEHLYVPERKPVRFTTTTSSLSGNTVFQLMEALKKVLERVSDDVDRLTTHEQVHIEDRVAHVLSFLQNQESATFTELFDDAQTKLHVIVTFIAILEMCNVRRLKVQQVGTFAELRVYRGDTFFDSGEIIVDEWGGPNAAEHLPAETKIETVAESAESE
ncbi:segregation/condensation protein A [Gemmatimonas aurantiaca]|nr:segregation/condensation protein A [Gemmatimonas aurantiaca]